MKVIMHYPDTPEKQEELAHQVAKCHAKSVITCINTLPCTYKEKLNLIEKIIRETKNYKRQI